MLANKSDCWSVQKYEEILNYTNKHLWRFIQKNSVVASAEDVFLNLTKVSKSNLQKLSNIYFILSDEVAEFIDETAPSILKRLSKSSSKEYLTLKGNVKGKINWSKTIATRYASGGDPSVFVCIQRSPVFDLPENRLLLYLLRRILLICNSLSNNIEFNKDTISLDNSIGKEKWIERVNIIGIKANKLIKNPFIRKIGDMHELSQKTIILAEKARGQRYTQLAQTARKYYTMINYPVDFLDSELQGKTLKPLNKDTLYEIAVLFKLLETVRDNGWVEKSIGLIGGSSAVISSFVSGKKEIKVYYQGIPKEFAQNSKYGPLMDKYGLSDKLRRPDIVLEVKNGTKKNYYIIEVKRSDKRSYLVDGAYKLFGYLKDFESVQNSETKLYGLLVGWSNIKDQDVFQENQTYISSWKNLTQIFDFILKNQINDN